MPEMLFSSRTGDNNAKVKMCERAIVLRQNLNDLNQEQVVLHSMLYTMVTLLCNIRNRSLKLSIWRGS